MTRVANPLARPGDHRAVALATASFAPVFPCLPNKRPATEHGFHDATTDPDRIYSWWGRHPDHLVGIPTEGLLVVDLDDRPDRPPGWEGWCRLAEPHGWTPLDAPMVGTPSGGVHIYFEQPEGVDVRNSASKLATAVDVRGNGGYVIAPGSQLPDGREYELLCPFPTELPVAPAWLVDLASRPSTPAVTNITRSEQDGSRWGLQALEAELGRLATAVEGTRNDTLVRAAYRIGQLVAGGQLDPIYAANELRLVALRIGLDESEVPGTIRSGMTSGAQHPRRPAA